MIYIIGSLRNPQVPIVANILRAEGYEAFDDWYAVGPEADDKWKEYETNRGNDYRSALEGLAAKHTFEFDKYHLDRCSAAVLVLPAGRSCHLEFGYMIGSGKLGWILLDQPVGKLPEPWHWLAGIYEGEGSITQNSKGTVQLSVSMKDKDIIERLILISKVGNLQGPYIRDNPKWSAMWRWSVYKTDDVLYILRSIWDHLSDRRKKQAETVLAKTNIILDLDGDSSKEYRFDVMYQFATGICVNTEDLIDKLYRRMPSWKNRVA